MKTLHDYISESETWATTPQPGDDFAIELAPDHLIESYVIETLEDGIVIQADERAMSLLEEYGCTTETIRRYGPVGSNRGVGFTVAEAGQQVDSLVTDALKIMRGSELSDAVQALKTVLGNREYNDRRGHYNFYVRQLMDMYSQQGMAEDKTTNIEEHGGGIGPRQRWQDLAEVDRMMELAGIAKPPMDEDNSGLAQKALNLAPVGAIGTEIDEDGTDPANQFGQDAEELTGQQTAEAKYHGREVPLGKPMPGDVKKSKVYVRDPATGNIKKVNFGHGGTSAKRAGQKSMHIKKDNPARRRSFRARHNCENPGPRTKARYWSCRAW